MAVQDWSTSASSNTSVGAINIGEGCPSANVNNGEREIMAQIRAVLTDAAISVLAQATVDEIREALGAAEGTDATNSIAALTPAADTFPYYTDTDTAALTGLSSFIRTLLDDADQAAARTTLGVIGVTSQSLVDNNGYRVYSDDYKECWGSVSVPAGGTTTVTLPTTHSSWFRVALGPYIKNTSGADSNIGLISVTQPSSFTLRNWENTSLSVDWSTRGV